VNGTTTINNPEALAFIVKYNVSSNLAAQVAGNDINAKISELNVRLENGSLTTNDVEALRSIMVQNSGVLYKNHSDFSAFNPYDVLLTYR
jgi:hypothetical protein